MIRSGDENAELRVGIVDDHALVRDGLRLVLERASGIAVAGEAEDRDAALALVARTRVDVLLLDIGLGDDDGILLIPALRARRSEMEILILTMHRDAETIRQALLAGAAGYVSKGARSSELVDAIRAVGRGERYLHSSVAASVVQDSLNWLQRGEPLSAREREILSLFAFGRSASEIGDALAISVHTVRRHLANIGDKLGVRGRAALTRYAADHGMIRGTSPDIPRAS